MTPALYAEKSAVGLLNGFSPVPHQLEVEVVVAHSERSLQVEMLEETLLAQLADRHPALTAQVRRLHLLRRQLVEELADDSVAPST